MLMYTYIHPRKTREGGKRNRRFKIPLIVHWLFLRILLKLTVQQVPGNPERKKVLFEYSKKFRKPSNKSCNDIKKLGGKKGLALEPSEIARWTDISIDVQNKISTYKIKNYEEVRNDLKRSETKMLVHPALRCGIEKCKERFWEGRVVIRNNKLEIEGQNMLGKIWMELRNKYMNIL